MPALPLTRLLLAAGARRDATDADGTKAVDLAEQMGEAAIVALLRG